MPTDRLLGEVIDHRQAFDPPPCAERVEDEVHRPDLVWCARQTQTFALHRDAMAAAPPFHHQAGSAVQAIDPLVVDLHASTPQQDVQAAIAKAPALLGQFHQLGLQLGVLHTGSRLVAQHRAGQPDQLTGTTLGDAGSRLHLLHRLPPCCRAYPFLRATTFSDSMSRWASASNFFNRLHGRQLCLDSAMAIDPIHLVVNGADLLAQTPIRHLSRRRWPLLPGIEAAAGYPQQPAHWRYGIATRQRLVGAELHFVGCEKMASAFFKTSRSMVT